MCELRCEKKENDSKDQEEAARGGSEKEERDNEGNEVRRVRGQERQAGGFHRSVVVLSCVVLCCDGREICG